MSTNLLEQAFDKVWTEIFSSPIHLDSALSKLKPNHKSIIAQVLPLILSKPVSLAEAVGVGLKQGEPWSLSAEELANWKTARSLFAATHRMMDSGLPVLEGQAVDFPPGMVAEIEQRFTVKNIFSILSETPTTTIRLSRKLNRDEIYQKWKTTGQFPVSFERSPCSPQGIVFKGYTPIHATPEYQAGTLEIQDEGSQYMALFALWPELFSPARYAESLQKNTSSSSSVVVLPQTKGSLVVVDACAGAGGKTLALGDAMGGKGQIFAYDRSEKKLLALKRRMTRAGLNNIKTKAVVEGQESDMLKAFFGKADIVLVDSPCSGWGVLRRNPDIKWRYSEEKGSENLKKIQDVQFRLLKTYSQLVKPGGSLVFGVCTFRNAETTELVSLFLQDEEIRGRFKLEEMGFVGPRSQGSDGFFMARFLAQ